MERGKCLQLTDREAAVCEIICNSDRLLSFTEIKDRLNMHQEILSRIIRRLILHGAIEKLDGKYRRKLVNN